MEIQGAFMGAAAAVVLLVAILVQRREPTTPYFAALTMAYGTWCAGRGAEGLGLGWGRVCADVALVAIGPLALAGAASLAANTELLRRLRPLLVLGPIALLAMILAGGARTPELHVTIHAWAFAGVVAGALALARFAPAAGEEDAPENVRLRYLAVAHGIVVLGAGGDTVLWQLDLPRVGSLLTPLLYLYAGYLHLARVRVADLRQLIGNAIALTIMAVGLAGFFAAIRIWVGERIDLFVFNAFVASFALLLGFERVRDRIQGFMDQRFVAGRLELERGLKPLRERLTHILTLDELLQALLATLEKTHQLRASSIFLRDDANLGFQQAGSIGLSPRTRVSLVRHPDFVAALDESDVLLYADLESARALSREGRERERLDTVCRTLSGLEAHLLLPLRGDDKVLGFWTLSDARSEESFATDEVKLLRAVADLIAISIQNSKTFERIRARDRLAGLGEMAAGLAHEIRNPLAAIRGAIAVMDHPADEEGSEFHAMIVQEIQRLDRVVETFLDYARPSTRSAINEDIGGFVERCAKSVARAPQRAGVELAIETEPGLPAICVDADQLERVLVNVVQNAYESYEGPGMIRVSTRRQPTVNDQETGVEIAVEDDGVGMSEETLERAFVPFYTTKERGTGMGLALCERLIRAQNGSIELTSRPCEGTTVRIRLAARPSEEPEAA